ncbi:MAG: phosphoribosylaminoimidazolecarboxamide formyltransferase [Clostridiales bacterium]|nr:phosphoribosylaminoimidazolecarboxamide formyltransferase [Clostridiales bacterium]
MKEFELKYGCNPNQKPASISMADGSDLPITILNGRPGYINFLDAFNSWQLVCELKAATGLPAAASFKHVSPAGAAIGLPLTPEMKRACFVDDIEGLDDSPLACAYARARGSDRMCSFGDWIALSDVCDKTTAAIIRREVSDGVIAPGYTDEAMELLLQKKRGEYNIVVMDPNYVPAPEETKQVFGVTFRQGRNSIPIGRELLGNIVSREKELPDSAVRDLLVALITLKYTQSNSVCYAFDGQAVGVGAGQQSRIHCTRLAGDKADKWFLRQSERVLSLPFRPELGRAERDNAIDVFLSDDYEDVIGDAVWAESFTEQPQPFPRAERQAWLKEHVHGVSLGSDAFFPFGDNVIRAHRSGVAYVAQPGGSKRDSLVIETCDACGMVMAFTGLRLFHH